MANILSINLKGGAGKTTGASIISSYIENVTLIEIDKINQSDKRIDSNGYYDSIQIDFNKETDESFYKFENMLLDDNIKVIDVGAVKLESFHKSMKIADLYNTIDLVVIPSMDGADDFSVAMDYLESIKDDILPEKIMFGFNRYNDNEYQNVEEQFDSFFDNKKVIKKDYGIDLDNKDNYYILKDSRAVKNARKKGVTLKSLAEKNVKDITAKQRSEKDNKKRMELTKERSLALNAQNFQKDYVLPMITKVVKKLGANNEANETNNTAE